MAAGLTLVVIVSADLPPVRDALAVVVAVGLVALFVGLRIIAFWLRHPGDRPWEFWGGMGATTDEVVARSRRPDGNRNRAPGLPDAVPRFDGHPLGQEITPEDPGDGSSGRGPTTF